MMKGFSVLLLLTCVSSQLRAQTGPVQLPETFYSGYERTLRGGGFIYHSPDPSVNSSMLVRSVDSTDYVEWMTAEVPSNFDGRYAYFAWMFGINVTPNSHLFSLLVNGKKVLQFSNPELSKKISWMVEGTSGVELSFVPTMIDQYNDLMGYAVLKLPLQLVERGKGQVLQIHGQSDGSQAWYMTFESPIREELSAEQVPAIVRHDGKQYDLIQFMATHLGKTAKTAVELSNGMKQNVDVHLGYNSFLVRIPIVRQAGTIIAKMELDGKKLSNTFSVMPIRDWTIYLVEHTHTDVGYAEPQQEIMPEQLRYIDYALDYCDKTDSYPADAQFHWTCETAWAVQQYLKTRPRSQVERLMRRIRQGRIEVTGMYLNMSDLDDESTLAGTMKTIRDFRNAGIDVTSAMQDDVNGAAWCLVDYLTSAGIKYFSMGENPTHALRPFRIPTAFWWESPSGKKILAYRGEHYQYANGLGILGPLAPFRNALFSYLNSLQSKGYAMNETMLQFSGYFTDDSPPSINACNLVRKWNDEFEWPRLKLATVGEFFKSVDDHYAAKLPTYRLAWPDWWTDGAGSCALETAYVRDAQAGYIVNQGLLSMAQFLGATIKPDALRAMSTIDHNLIFFDEHTFGAAESVSNPLSMNATVQWNNKAAYAWTAVKENGVFRQASLGLLRPYISKLKMPTIDVFNTMNVERSGVARFFAYDNILPPNKEIVVLDASGNRAPIQVSNSGPGGNYWDLYAKDVPPFGYKIYKIIVEDKPAPEVVERAFDGTLENQYYTLRIDSAKGGIVSLMDKSGNLQLVDPKAPWELGQFIYERVKNTGFINSARSVPYDPNMFTRTSLTKVRLGKVIRGQIWTSVDITGQVRGCATGDGVTCQVRLYKDQKKIQLVFSMVKQQVFKPEAVYVAFPFKLSDSHIAFEVQGGTVVPGKGQLPGTASDWDGVQNFAAVRGQGNQIVFVSPEVPLMQFGDINTGKWQESDHVEKPYIYSYVLNNYWDTNFPAAQEGGLRWRYDITSTSDTSKQFATNFGWGMRVPLTAALRPGGGESTKIESGSFLDFGSSSLLLVFARPAWDGKGVVLCLREVEGKETTLNVRNLVKHKPGTHVYEVNSLEENPREVKGKVGFDPYQVKFLMLR